MEYAGGYYLVFVFLCLLPVLYAFGGWKSSGFMLILHSFETHPLNCNSD